MIGTVTCATVVVSHGPALAATAVRPPASASNNRIPIADTVKSTAAVLTGAAAGAVSRRLSRNQTPPKYPDTARLPNRTRT